MHDNQNRYKQELDNIKASEEFKKNTMELLANAAKEERETQSSPTAPTPAKDSPPIFRRWQKVVLAAASFALVALLAIRALPEFGMQSDMAASLAAPEAADAWDEGAEYEAAADVYISGYFGRTTRMLASESLEMATEDTDTVAGRGEASPPAAGNEPTENAVEKAAPSFTFGDAESTEDGYEGVQLYSFDEYTGVLLQDGVPATLPAYRNTAVHTLGGGYSGGLNEDELESLVADLAGALGRYGSPQLDVVYAGGQLQSATGDWNGLAITARPDRRATVTLDEDSASLLPLPPAVEESGQLHSAWAQSVVDYDLYGIFGGMAQPTAEAVLSYTPAGEAQWAYNVYDRADAVRGLAGGTLLVKDGALTGFELWNADTSDLLGSYATITEAEALELLAGGEGITTVPQAFPGVNAVQGADLVYLYTGTEQALLPLYKFFVELPEGTLPEDSPEGLASYGVWYVPAVETD